MKKTNFLKISLIIYLILTKTAISSENNVYKHYKSYNNEK